jgi:hypothetical protein
MLTLPDFQSVFLTPDLCSAQCTLRKSVNLMGKVDQGRYRLKTLVSLATKAGFLHCLSVVSVLKFMDFLNFMEPFPT